MYAVVVTNEPLIWLAGQVLQRAKLPSGPLMRAKHTGQHYPARPPGQELGRQHLPPWQNAPSSPPGGPGGGALSLLELTPQALAVGLKISAVLVYHPSA